MKSNYHLTEQETTINLLPSVVSKQAEIFSCVPAMMDKLRKLAAEHPSEVSIIEKDGCVQAAVPASWVKIQPKRKCNLTEEQRRANAERLAAYREARKS